MGGKDFIVVDEDADFEFAVSQVVASAFGFQGQKCSACSRAIVHRRLYRRFVDAVVAKTAKLTQGPTRDHRNFLGPVASERQLKTVTDYVKVGKREAKLGTGGTWNGRVGNFVAPTVFYDVKPSGADLPGGDLRPRPRDHRGEGLRDGARARERERVRAHGLVLRARPLPHRGSQEAPPLREPLHQPQVHGRARRRPPVRRLRHVRHRQQGRRPRLPRAVPPSQEHLGEALSLAR